MIKWAVANQKGGVGKTTTVVNLGGCLCAENARTLLIDMDPHGSMTAYFGLDPDSIENSLYQLFRKESSQTPLSVKELVIQTKFENLFLLPASTAMATLDRQLGAKEGMGLVLLQALQAVEQQFDYAIIDCPPQLGILMVNALAACEHLIIPVQTEFLALKGLERMMRTLLMVGKALQKDLQYTILPTMYDVRTRASRTTLKKLQETYPTTLWNKVVPVDTLFREASRLGVPLTLRVPNDRGSQAYAELLHDLRQELQLPSVQLKHG
ncbi:MAG: ParA family protein [Gammaproteobacteria bacterium]|nr:ParA family protein [Gammaproteobacteria bacterium]MDH5802632.1 ParA family protein [Gammaproteobacteria bacterium]